MDILENISLLQRMTGSVKADIEAGEKYKALGKIEILEGELGILRQGFEPTEEENVAEDVSPVVEDNVDVVDSEATEVIE